MNERFNFSAPQPLEFAEMSALTFSDLWKLVNVSAFSIPDLLKLMNVVAFPISDLWKLNNLQAVGTKLSIAEWMP